MDEAVDALDGRGFEATREDWDATYGEWREAYAAAALAGEALDWSALTPRAVDTWLAACERVDIARVRVAALCEAGLRQK